MLNVTLVKFSSPMVAFETIPAQLNYTSCKCESTILVLYSYTESEFLLFSYLDRLVISDSYPNAVLHNAELGHIRRG